MCVPLYIVFSTSLKNGIIPNDWKLANIIATYKKGNRMSPTNYLPISLTSIVCKILENIVRDQLVQHLKSNKFFTDKQIGFIKGYSATLQMLNIVHR